MQKHEYYSEEEKLHLLHSYYQSGMSKTSFCKQHGISGITLLNKWLAKYESVVKRYLWLRVKPLRIRRSKQRGLP